MGNCIPESWRYTMIRCGANIRNSSAVFIYGCSSRKFIAVSLANAFRFSIIDEFKTAYAEKQNDQNP
jgi:hypothetical protein